MKEFAAKWGYESIETDWRKLIERKDIDAIDICTPNNTHKEIAIAAAKAGKMILCEKPLSMDTAEGEEMVTAVEKAGGAEHGLVQLPPRAGGDARQAADRRRASSGGSSTTARTSCRTGRSRADLPQGGAGLWRLDVRGRRVGRDRRPARPLHRHRHLAQRLDHATSTR